MTSRRTFLKLSSASAIGLVFCAFKKESFLEASKINYNILLGRATQNSIAMNLMLKNDADVFIEYGKDKSKLELKTQTFHLTKNNPQEFLLDGLLPNQKCFYRVCYQINKNTLITREHVFSFHTQREKGNGFVFTIAADSHLGTLKHCDPALYQLTLNNVVKDNPDLHFSLGDDFRASKVNEPNYNKIEQLYLDQREHLGTLCNQVPLYFVLGNHEMEAKAFNDGTENCLAAWSTKARKKFVPNPYPNSFYSGNIGLKEEIQRQNYYAFEWGDVLFLTLDVFYYSNISAEDEEMREKNKLTQENISKEERLKLKEDGSFKKNTGGGTMHKDQWAFTIGKEQYDWLQKTLSKSKAKYKFVMGHHVMGSCRGAVEWANMFEWGGGNRRGINEFKQKRPDWEMPIHSLFVKHKVNAFIQGHDHLFARQELDGIAYITCPMSGDPGYNTYNSDGYLSGDKLSNTGHLKIIVSAKDVQMQYIKSVLPKDEMAQGKNGRIAYAYSFTDKKVLPVS